MKLADIKRLMLSNKINIIDSNKVINEIINTKKSDFLGLLTEDGQYIGYQELEMSSPYIDAYEITSTRNSIVSLHSHIFYEIIFCKSDNVQCLIGNMRYNIKKGSIIIIPPGTSHRPIFLKELHYPYQRSVIWVNSSFYNQCRDILMKTEKIEKDPITNENYVIYTTGSLRSQIQEIIEILIHEKTQSNPCSEFYCYGLFIQLYCLFYKAYYYKNVYYSKPEKTILLDEILQYISDNLSQRITTKSVADYFHVSQSTINQLFKKSLNTSIYKLITQKRLIKSKNLIKANVPLKEIPDQCGFSDYSVFYKAFIKEYGVSPKEFKSYQ